MINGSPDPTPRPPEPLMQAAVWPPPPMISGQAQSGVAGPACGFKWLYRRVPGTIAKKALVADYRVGSLQCDSEGIILLAKAVPRAEIRLMVMLPLIFLSMPLALIASLVMEYGMRKDRREGIRWGSVRQVLLAPAKGQAGIIYDAYNHAAQMKTYSLAFTVTGGDYEAFAGAARRNVPDRLEEGALVSATPPVLWVLLGIVAVALLGLVLLAIHKP